MLAYFILGNNNIGLIAARITRKNKFLAGKANTYFQFRYELELGVTLRINLENFGSKKITNICNFIIRLYESLEKYFRHRQVFAKSEIILKFFPNFSLFFSMDREIRSSEIHHRFFIKHQLLHNFSSVYGMPMSLSYVFISSIQTRKEIIVGLNSELHQIKYHQKTYKYAYFHFSNHLIYVLSNLNSAARI